MVQCPHPRRPQEAAQLAPQEVCGCPDLSAQASWRQLENMGSPEAPCLADLTSISLQSILGSFLVSPDHSEGGPHPRVWEWQDSSHTGLGPLDSLITLTGIIPGLGVGES